MIKNQLYPYIEEYINSFLYGFTKEQLDVGIMKGEIKFESLNLRPDGVNEVLDKSNTPFWLKAGLISKINFGCSLMNFIGEKPIEANFEGVNIILCPSYKWILQNMDNFLFEDLKEMKMEYSASDNNSVNIFGKKINVLDNSIFRKEKLEEFFKDKTIISELLNKIIIDCFEFYYGKNYALILKLKNIHIRFEDDQLINYFGNIAFGIKVDSFELTLSSEGIMKKNNLKISKLDFYWENNANILIPSNILYDSIKNGCLNDSYYTNLNKIKFQNYSFQKDTKYIINNLNCLCNFGTKAITKGKIDIFAKKENNYKLYIQFASNEIKINFFPDLLSIKNNFQKFTKDFTIISQAQEFKPMKKPYNNKNQNFIEIMNLINKNINGKLCKKFSYKRNMLVRDWLFYFYWCHKCKSSIYNFNLNPLRAEFSRFINIYYQNELDKINDLGENDNKKINNNENKDNIWTRERPNPDKINLILNIDIKIKGINLNLYPSIYSAKDIKNEFILIKIINPDLKFILNQEKCEINCGIKNIVVSPNKLKAGEKIIVSNNIIKKQEINVNQESNNKQRNNYNNNILNNYSKFLTENNIESNTGITGFMKKYNPNYSQQLKVIDKAMEKINDSFKKASNHQSHNNSKTEINNDTTNQENKENEKIKLMKNYNTNRERNHTNFSQNLIRTYEATPSLQKLELNRQKNEFNISQAVNHYNILKSQSRLNTDSNIKNIPKPDNLKGFNTSRITSTKQNNKIISTGKILPLNLLEIYTDNDDNNTNNNKNNITPCFSFKYIKTNNNTNIDILKIFLGIIRINLFSDYISKFVKILNEYNINKSIIKLEKNNDLKLDKNVFLLKKYILKKVEQMPNVDKNKNEYIKNYINYLKNELEKGKLILQSESSELNYIFSYFSKGIEINFDYNNLECIYYSNKNNKFCGKALIPSPQFNFKINNSNINLKLYDFDFEFNDLENANILFKTISNIFEDKFKIAKIMIEPCLQKIKKEIEDKEKNDELSTEEHVGDKFDFENELNRILNNKKKENNHNIKHKINANKIFSENIHNNNINKISQKNKEKHTEIEEIENQIIKNLKKSKNELSTENHNDIKEIKELKEKNQIIEKKEILEENEIKEIKGNKRIKRKRKKRYKRKKRNKRKKRYKRTKRNKR